MELNPWSCSQGNPLTMERDLQMQRHYVTIFVEGNRLATGGGLWGIWLTIRPRGILHVGWLALQQKWTHVPVQDSKGVGGSSLRKDRPQRQHSWFPSACNRKCIRPGTRSIFKRRHPGVNIRGHGTAHEEVSVPWMSINQVPPGLCILYMSPLRAHRLTLASITWHWPLGWRCQLPGAEMFINWIGQGCWTVISW